MLQGSRGAIKKVGRGANKRPAFPPEGGHSHPCGMAEALAPHSHEAGETPRMYCHPVLSGGCCSHPSLGQDGCSVKSASPDTWGIGQIQRNPVLQCIARAATSSNSLKGRGTKMPNGENSSTIPQLYLGTMNLAPNRKCLQNCKC